jgi:hypothetical protein
MIKEIIINQTSGAPALVVTTIAQTWEELKTELIQQNVNLSNVKAIIGETRVTLESNSAILPEGNFNLYLLPKKTKSGMSKPVITPTKETIVESKKSVVKKASVAKKATPVKKASANTKSSAISKAVAATTNEAKKISSKKKLVLEESNEVAKVEKEVVKELSDSQKILVMIEELKQMKIKNSRVSTLVDACNVLLEDVGFIIETGKSRLNNLKNKQTLNDLLNSRDIER